MSLMSTFMIAAAGLGSNAEPAPTPAIECVAGGGQFHLIKVTGSATPLSAQVRVQRQKPQLLAVGEWSPAAGLLFVLSGKNQVAGIQVYVNSNEPEKLRIVLRRPGTGGITDFAEAPAGATVPIAARLENGILTVFAGGIQKTAKVDDKMIKGAALMCSSGTFEFSLGQGLQIDPLTLQQSFDPWDQGTK